MKYPLSLNNILILFFAMLCSVISCSNGSRENSIQNSANADEENRGKINKSAILEIILKYLKAMKSEHPNRIIDMIENENLKQVINREKLIQQVAVHMDGLKDVKFSSDINGLRIKYRLLEKDNKKLYLQTIGIRGDYPRIIQLRFFGQRECVLSLANGKEQKVKTSLWDGLTVADVDGDYRILTPVVSFDEERHANLSSLLDDIEWKELSDVD